MYTNPFWEHPSGEQAVGQVFKVVAISGNTITVDRPLHINYNPNLSPMLRPKVQIESVGLENFRIEQINSGANTFNFSNAAYCWVRNVESAYTTHAHINITRSLNCEVRDCYFHHSFDYGGGGRGYGIASTIHTTNNLFENNIFSTLRHAMIVSKGSTGNVFTYNYSRDQTWQFAHDAADMSIHGHYPSMNLFEGNIVEYAHNSDYWGPSAPGNTFYRNRITKTNIIVSDHSHNQNVVGNEILNGSITIAPSVQNTWLWSNNVQGVIQNQMSEGIEPSCIYTIATRPDFLREYPFPIIGPEYPINMHTIPAKARYDTNTHMETCACRNIDLSSSNLSGDYEVGGQIMSTGKIQSNAEAAFDAGHQIKLLPGFSAKPGSTFYAYIDGCSN